jgi:hypothetical protein
LQLSDIVETAALVSAHAPHVIESESAPCQAALERFWHASRSRSDDRIRRLTDASTQAANLRDVQRARFWEGVTPLLEEVFVQEMLSRVWSAVLIACDQHRGETRCETIARNTLIGQMHVRQQALQVLLCASNGLQGEAARANRVRRKAERWTDILLAHLTARYDLNDSAFDAARASDFAEGQFIDGRVDPRHATWEFIMAGLRLAFANVGGTDDRPDTQRREIVASILGSFPPDAFTANGPFRSIERVRLERGSERSERTPLNTPYPSIPAPRVSPLSEAADLQGISFAALRKRKPLD